MDYLPCPGCARLVYGSSSSYTLLSPMPLTGLCRTYVDGSTLRAVRATGVLPARQHLVLACAAA
ncbi:hypothetical protein [Streptomyces aidingensis]|uniref:hypothetical protein n=1 Tax=Streptomyces aidingensis TaxID=910347 RepID=UPI000B8789D4|nr:hypothetical protein [Streptomyces aidingensis]